MRNYNNPNNKYAYHDLDRKKKRAKNLLWLLILLLFLSAAIGTVIVLGVLNSWFAITKQEGEIQFENGIVMSYKGIQVKQDNNFYLVKQDENGTSALNEMNIKLGSEFDIVSPKISATAGSTAFVLRAKLDLTFTKEINGQIKTLNLTQLTAALNEELTTNNTEAETLALIFDDMLKFNDGFTNGGDGWFYFTNKTNWTNTGTSPNFNDMYKFNSPTKEVSVFKTEANKTTSNIKVVSEDMETFYVKSCKILVTFDAIESNASAFDSWLAE